MFRILFLLFVLIPIIEIGVFILVGDQLGLGPTIAIVIITAVIGVNLLKQQGFVAIRDIQDSMNQGKMPALELAAGAQLLFAGGLLLTPGFVTDSIGFLLMIPAIRMSIARFLITRISLSTMNGSSFQFKAGSSHYSQSSYSSTNQSSKQQPRFHSSNQQRNHGRVIEGELAPEESNDHTKTIEQNEK